MKHRADDPEESGFQHLGLTGHAEVHTEGDLTEAEKRQLRKERREALARKVRLGFRKDPLP